MRFAATLFIMLIVTAASVLSDPQQSVIACGATIASAPGAPTPTPLSLEDMAAATAKIRSFYADRYIAIFRGRVIGIEPVTLRGLAYEYVTLHVDTSWKGEIASTIRVLNHRYYGNSCGTANFAQGADYLVYAEGTDRGLEVPPGTPTRLAAEASDDIGALGPGIAITASTATQISPANTVLSLSTATAAPTTTLHAKPSTPRRILLLLIVGGVATGASVVAVAISRKRQV